MEAGGQSETAAGSVGDAALRGDWLPRAAKRRPLLARDVQLYRVCDDLTKPLIYGMVVFSPWAFGTTQSWSIWVMNGAGYLLGLLLVCKLNIRWRKGYGAARWEDGGKAESRKQKAESGGQTTGLRDYGTTGLRDFNKKKAQLTSNSQHTNQKTEIRAHRSVVSGQWSVVSGPSPMVPGPWSLVRGPWSAAPPPGSPVFWRG